MRISRMLAAVVSLLLLVPVGVAEDAPPMPAPTPEHAVLGMWVGEWAGSGEMKEGPFGPGGPMSWTEKCSWFGGAEFHVVCKSEGTGPMGDMKGLGIMGYNPDKKVYTHYGIDSNGWTGQSEGTRDGDTWRFKSEETMGGKKYHTGFSMTMVSPTKMTFAWKMSEDGENWITMMEGTTEKKK